MFHREFLWPTSAKWVQTLIFCIIVIRNGLNIKRSPHFWLKFMLLFQLLISLWLVMTCVIPSQMAYSFIISNASCSMHCSSVEACLLWKCCYQSVLINHELHGIFYLWYYLWQEICAINAQSSYSNKRTVLVIISMWSLVSIQQQSPQVALWHITPVELTPSPIPQNRFLLPWTPNLSHKNHCSNFLWGPTVQSNI